MIHSKRAALALALIAILFSLSPRAIATITVISDWRLGESDPGVVSGIAATNTIDLTGLRNLGFQGSANYSSDVSFPADAHTGSYLAINFTNNAYATNTIVSTATDNFGVEAWVKPTATANGTIVYNGNTATSGWGLTAGAGVVNGLYGGVDTIGSSPLAVGVWTHIALVCSGGTSTLYVNGVSAGSKVVTPHVPAGNFGLACPPQSPTGQFFTGLIDEVRVFTFSAGQFTTSDLLVNSHLERATPLYPTEITATNATLNAAIVPGGLTTAAWIDWGTTGAYGNSNAPVSVGNGQVAVAISNKITGLIPGRAYHFRAVATNSSGFARSWDSSFATPALNISGGTNQTIYAHEPLPVATLAATPLILSANDSPNGMVLKADGSVVVWGDNSSSQTNIAASFSNIIDIAAANFHYAALKRDGTVVAWGINTVGQTNVPTGLYNVVAVGGGGDNTLALQRDGTVVCWGANAGQFSSQSNVVQISASLANVIFLTADGVVSSSFAGVPPPNATNIVSVAAGSAHAVALRADGLVIAWGFNGSGQTNVPPNATNAIAVAATGSGSMALLADGTVLAWGSNDGNKNTVPSSATNVIAIAAAGAANFALRADGVAIGWGSAANNQTLVPSGLTNITGTIVVTGTVNTNSPGTNILMYATTNFLGAVNSAVVSVQVALPSLTLTPTIPQTINLAWPTNATGYLLQQTALIQSNGWTAASSGATNPVTIPATNAALFYRLIHP